MSEPPVPQIARFWWITVLRGVFALALGVAAITSSGGRSTLANFIGAYWLIGAVLTTRFALSIKWERGSRLGVAAGVFGMVAACVVLLRRFLLHVVSPDLLLDLLGVSAILTGVLRLLGAFEVRKRTGRRWTFGGFALGTLEIVLGVVLILAGTTSTQGIAVVAGTWGIVGGTLLLIDGFRLRGLTRIGKDT